MVFRKMLIPVCKMKIHMMNSSTKIIISGGGTGGHVFPAIAIAKALREKDRSVEILFVGAQHRMEMQQVPAAGFSIIGLPVRGFQRKFSFKNILFPYYLLVSMVKARKIIKTFRPHVVVGVGGYASGPVARSASAQGIPVLIQEQNSYAGITNRLLAKKAEKICVAYEGMEAYFPAEKIVLAGNPVRRDLLDLSGKREEAAEWFGIRGNGKVILFMGGSLGAGSINNSLSGNIEKIAESGTEIIWQTGKSGFKEAVNLSKESGYAGLHICEFISRMDLAYAAADLVVSRAGAGTISELSVTGKPAILIPSPNVAEDHQTKNAMALTRKDAAVLIRDADCYTQLIPAAISLAGDASRLAQLSKNISEMAFPGAAERIAGEILNLVKKRESEGR
jgi:UDP-N-acetylglucosamine--N-acetylmuramyl-(pentapeptide) pyrophosphoryl-undecaprenol N-acetylglucosamine transferase